MNRPDRSTYTALDFQQWHESSGLILSPKFQRRGVWNRAQRSFFIDTLLLGLPVPPIYIRVVQSNQSRRIVREIIDGQQRLSAVLDYISGKYILANKIESPCAGKRFHDLHNDEQQAILTYPFIAEVFYGVSDRDVLKIFARLNTHSVKLNDQELRNGEYFGPFKRTCYDLALEHLEFWRTNGLVTEQGIARMQEVELTSELVIIGIAGMQDKKKSIGKFYAQYDDDFPQREQASQRFRCTIDAITESALLISDDGLKGTQFRRVPLFYSLYAAVYHRLFGIADLAAPTTNKRRLSQDEIENLSNAILTLSQLIENTKAGHPAAASHASFLNACVQQTDNIRPRRIRADTIYRAAFD